MDPKEQEAKAAADKAAADAAAAKAAGEWKPPTREDHEKTAKELADIRKELEATRKEAADRRVKAKEADDAKAATEKAAAEAKGEWAKVLELERAERKKIADDLAAVSGKASKVDRYEAVIKAEVGDLEKVVGPERAASVAHLSPEDRLPILKQFAALSAGAGRAQQTTQGKPAPQEPSLDLGAMSDEDRREYLAKLGRENPDELRRIAGAGAKSTPFGWGASPKK